MTNQIQFVNTKPDRRLEELILGRLEKIESKFAWVIGAKVFLKEENASNGKNKVCEIDLSVPGPNIFTKTTEASFEASIAESFNELNILLRKHKGKIYGR